MISMAEIVEKIEYLPMFDETAQKALIAIQKEDYSISELTEVIKYDPALTANILKVANSAYYAHSKKINNISTAINYLGKEQLFSIIAVSASKKYFLEMIEGYEENNGELWEHNLAVAMISKELKTLEPIVDENDLFIAALLHDIGKVILGSYVKRKRGIVINLIETGNDFISVEKKVFGFTHPKIGAAILKRWNFSKDVVHAVKYHHDQDHWNRPITRVVALSDYFSQLIGKMSQKDALAYKGYDKLLLRYKINSQQLEKLLSDTLEKINFAMSVYKN